VIVAVIAASLLVGISLGILGGGGSILTGAGAASPSVTLTLFT
jgi:hypothetical protein